MRCSAESVHLWTCSSMIFLKHVNQESETEALTNAHNSLLEAAISILGEVIFNRFFDAFVQLVLCDAEERFRR
jgi:hypothetical protein